MKNTLLAVGCSHTAGVGVKSDEIYVQLLADDYNLYLDNRSLDGGNHSECVLGMIECLRNSKPELIIAQWPAIYRRTEWKDDKKQLANIRSCQPSFLQLLAESKFNFISPWVQSVVTANTVANLIDVPIVNICLDDVEEDAHQQLAQYEIKMHVDEKLPGRSWIFDSAGSDGLHHSAQCHRAWAQRLKGIINEITN